ncbi:hypothetical protein B2J93_9466 [Marssonina coronariae]|uniref:EGF-like domain-containing protein n=1 Tax=Diplocarpon coronariae TaxID=2795749 RepID=A0A218YVM8_9HELO|nr:hypothetical protein B2J93_9466 [Marssonina coronariae]
MSNRPWQPPSRIPRAAGNGSAPRGGERTPAVPYPDMLLPPRMAAPNPQARPRPPMPIALPGRAGRHPPPGAAISRPTQVQQQWPLPVVTEPGPRQNHPRPGRGRAPPRPPRPSQVPIAFDISQLEVESPTSQYSPEIHSPLQHGGTSTEEDEDASPITASPLTQTSLSSAGSIPDFPIPVPPVVTRRTAHLGPPPSSRRGVSSYYSRASFVSPIPEESPRATPHVSYASSAAIPTSWDSSSQRYAPDEDDEEKDEARERRSFDRSPSIEDEGRDSRASGDDHDDERGLIRSASFGRRAKPSMINTRSIERLEPRAAPAPEQKPIQMANLERAGTPLSAAQKEMGLEPRHSAWPTIGHSASPLASGTGLIDKSEESLALADAAPAYERDPSPTAMLGAYHAASSLHSPSPGPNRTPSPGESAGDAPAAHRPPRLNLDAVRNAEARGSLTSLSDLIKRATRLASMIDRGKRPASRMAWNDFPSNGDFKEIGRKPRPPFPRASRGGRNSANMQTQVPTGPKARFGRAGTLDAFPHATAHAGVPGDRPTSHWPTSQGSSSDSHPRDPADQHQPTPRRRCCGLPCWGFILVLLVLLAVVAAAIVIPVKFLVLDKAGDAPSRAAPADASSCAVAPATSCQNGGTSTFDERGCACICTNGFSGSTCSEASSTGCSAASNATMGDAISRLLVGARNFSIPLDQETILARFNDANASCATENALVTFMGSAGGSVASEKRQVATPSGTPTRAAPGAVATLHSLIYDSSTPAPMPPGASPPQAPPTPSTTPAAGTEPHDPNADLAVTDAVLDFSRVALLYILQQQTFETAVTAHGALEGFLELDRPTNLAARNVSVGGGNTVDLVGGWVDVGMGGVGGTGVGS